MPTGVLGLRVYGSPYTRMARFEIATRPGFAAGGPAIHQNPGRGPPRVLGGCYHHMSSVPHRFLEMSKDTASPLHAPTACACRSTSGGAMRTFASCNLQADQQAAGASRRGNDTMLLRVGWARMYFVRARTYMRTGRTCDGRMTTVATHRTHIARRTGEISCSMTQTVGSRQQPAS